MTLFGVRTTYLRWTLPLLAAGACSDGPTAPARSHDPERTGIFTPRVSVLTGDVGSAFALAYARAMAENGDRRLLDFLTNAPEEAGNPAAGVLLTPEDGAPAEILAKNTMVSGSVDQATVIASMTFKGDAATNTIVPFIVNIDRNWLPPVAELSPVVDLQIGWGSRLNPHSFSTSMSVTVPGSCGLQAGAETVHEAWWLLVPVPMPLSAMPPWMRIGDVTAQSSDAWEQPHCAQEGTGGNTQPILMGHYECYYTDYYDPDDYSFIGTVFHGCALMYTYLQPVT